TDAWQFVRTMVDDLTRTIEEDAETERERLEGLRVLGRITALCAELSLDVDVDDPWFFSMNSEARLVGGPNPDGEYHLAMIDGTRRYRVSGLRGTSAYLGFQVLAGRGLTPRRMAAYVSDGDLEVDDDGRFSFVLAPARPTQQESDGDRWVELPEDASAIVVRQYIADRTRETVAELAIAALDPPGSPPELTDAALAEQLTAMAWTMAKLATLHRTIRPDLLTTPNHLATSEAADLGAADTTPDNLYMLGTFRLDPGEALVVDLVPPGTRYWSVTLENIWHECIDPRRRRSSITNAGAVARRDGTVRIVIAASDPGADNWLDTGGRHRGFVTVRWLDNPDPPPVTTTLSALSEIAG
ncbi:MAG: DUF1214 domain-containing protein, partial [Acidimicrobiales bacterium]